MTERPCDCIACEARRLAWRLFLAGIAVLVLLAIADHAGEAAPLAIDPPEAPAPAVPAKAQAPLCTAPWVHFQTCDGRACPSRSPRSIA